MDLDRLRARLASTTTLRPAGRVRGVTGLTVRLSLPGARVGDVVILRRRGEPLTAEVVGFDEGAVLAIPLGDPLGLGPDDEVESTGGPLRIPTGRALLGRILDGLGRAADGQDLPEDVAWVPAEHPPPPALSRRPVERILHTGVRAVDGLLSLGVGQRVGLFAGSGVGKSTLLGSIARGTNADVVVIALVGERGREVLEFIGRCLDPESRQRAVIVVATSDAPALERLRAAQVATAHAEYFRDLGLSVLLLIDSITRFARAQREVGLSAGEPPTRRGYPPSVFALLPRLLERAGNSDRGSISAIYTVLVEGGDLDEPIADEVRGILDGHVVLDRQIAARGTYPAIDIKGSVSRVMGQIVDAEHAAAARVVQELIATYEEKRDLITIGAYCPGSDERIDRAIRARRSIEGFLQQPAHDRESLAETRRKLLELARSSC